MSIFVCLCVRALKGKRLELSTPNLVHIMFYSSRWACIDLEVKRSKVKVTWLLWPCAAAVWDCTSYDCLGF